MELQLSNLPALQTQPANLSAGELEIIQAIDNPKKVKTASELELKQVLAYCFGVVGLHPDKFPDAAAAAVLVDFILSEFPNHSLDEIRLAFKMAAAGKTECDIRHFQTFSAAYFSDVVNAYRKVSGEIYRVSGPHRGIPEPEVQNIPDPEFIEQMYQLWKKTGKHQFIPVEIYHKLEAEIFPGTKLEKIERQKSIMQTVEMWIKAEIATNESFRINFYDKTEEEKKEFIKNESRKYAVAVYFNTQYLKNKK